MRVLQAFVAAVLTASIAVAQCPFSSVSVSSYGQGCNPAFGDFNVPTLSPALNAANCSLDLTVTANSGCCNVYLLGRILAIGFQQVPVPLTCSVLTSNDVILFQPAQASGVFSLPLSNALPPITIWAQPAALYLTTIGLSYDLALGAGSRLDLQ